jgi:hypothetical protein
VAQAVSAALGHKEPTTMKNIPYLLQALIALLVVVLFSMLDDNIFGVDLVTNTFNVAFATTAWLFVGYSYWRQTIADMRANFDDIDNQRMLTQLSSGSGSMLLPMFTVIVGWPVFAFLAFVIAMLDDTVFGPLTNP